MPYIPHTERDIQEMLSAIGVASTDDLFDEIPQNLLIDGLPNIPEGVSEMQLFGEMRKRALQDTGALCFIGAGAYEHHVPAAVWDVATRGEFLTAYTPYQAEASQGTLQLIYEYQTMMADLMGLDVSNASLYDGATALAEAILMAVRIHKKSKSKRVLIPRTLHPTYQKVAKTIVSYQGIILESVDFERENGILDPNILEQYANEDITAVVIPQPNFFGNLEQVDELTDAAHQLNALVIGVVNPTAMALIKEPGSWGASGADLACGEGQPLGIPLASGGPYFGFLCCKKAYVRQMPGRIIGRTHDTDGRQGFVLTLQAREQHIRRAKATSNICTNQGLAVTASTIYMSLLGYQGLRKVALASHQSLNRLLKLFADIEGVRLAFSQPHFHEAVITLPISSTKALQLMAERGIQGGYDLSQEYPELGNSILLCVTETKTDDDLKRYSECLRSIL